MPPRRCPGTKTPRSARRRAGNALCVAAVRPAVTRSRLLLGVASVLAGSAALFVVLGATVNLLLAAAAVPFGVAAYFLWSHATGRLAARVSWIPVDDAARARAQRRRRRAAERRRGADPTAGAWAGRTDRGAADGDRDGRRATGAAADDERGMDRQTALRTLGLRPGADQAAVRRAYRDRAKAVHPDAEDGDERAFRRVTAAYERLRER